MQTHKRKLFTGLAVAGVVAGGFGATVLPASAEPRTIKVTLAGGQSITLTVDVPPGTPLDQIPLPGISLPILKIEEVGGPSGPSPVPVTPITPAPQPAPEQPQDGAPADAPRAEEQQAQKTTGKAKRKARVDDGLRGTARADRDRRRQRASKLREADGRPTIQNPTFSLALPGPAPIGVPNFFIEKFRIPPFLLPIYQAAGIEYGIRWEILAAINEIETDYGRNLNVSSAGAVGWMQFMPASWKAYGVDANRDGRKDPYNPVDAIFAAARYLKAADADTDLRKAIFAYNHADWYVESVLLRARLIGGMPSDLVGSLTGLTQGHFPVHAKATYADDVSEREARRRVAKGRNAAMPIEGDGSRRGLNIYAKAGSPVIAVQDGRITAMGTHPRLGRFIQLRDVYGNTYTYGHLKKVATAHPVPKKVTVSRDAVRRELELPKADKAPTAPASAGAQVADKAKETATKVAKAAGTTTDPATDAGIVEVTKQRIFANPARERAAKAGGEEQVLQADLLSGSTTFRSYFTKLFGLERDDVEIKKLKVGSKVVAGTILGRIGRTSSTTASHVLFEIRPAGRGAPRIDPKPILDGWKLLESTAIYRSAGRNPFFGDDARGPSIGQILLMSKQQLQRRVLANPRVEIYECGRRDIAAGIVDRRVLATLEFLAAGGLKPTVTSLRCGHSYLTASGNVSHHSTGSAVDIARINGIPVLGHQGAGSVTEAAIRRLLTLQGTMKPSQIISLMTFDGTDNTVALPDHADHIHVGWAPMYDGKNRRKVDAVLKPSQWIKLIDRLGQIDNPHVRTTPSKESIKVPRRASDAHDGE